MSVSSDQIPQVYYTALGRNAHGQGRIEKRDGAIDEASVGESVRCRKARSREGRNAKTKTMGGLEVKKGLCNGQRNQRHET